MKKKKEARLPCWSLPCLHEAHLERQTSHSLVSRHFRMLLLNYLGKIGSKTPLMAAATFSVGWNTFACSESLEKPLNWLLFNYYLTTCLQSSVKK